MLKRWKHTQSTHFDMSVPIYQATDDTEMHKTFRLYLGCLRAFMVVVMFA